MKKYKKGDLESYTLGTTLTLELLNKKIEKMSKNTICIVRIHSR